MEFYAPYLSATGNASAGFDSSVDLVAPIRATAVKGAMRAVAAQILCLREDVINQLFGSEEEPAAWRWLINEPTAPVEAMTLHRVAIDDETMTARADHLLRARAAKLPRVSFCVQRRGRSLDEESLEREKVALTAAARGVHALGAQRTRGLGWVGITGGVDLSGQNLEKINEWRSK